jgi:hypothetical protein
MLSTRTPPAIPVPFLAPPASTVEPPLPFPASGVDRSVGSLVEVRVGDRVPAPG